MKIASHNTMTYLKPSNWVKWFPWPARCQSKNYVQQYNKGCRMFDLRIAFDKEGKPYFAHGLADYKIDKFWNVFESFNKLAHRSLREDNQRVWIRIIKEKGGDSKIFYEFCETIEEKYKHIQFCAGWDKKGRIPIYPFMNKETRFRGDDLEPDFIDKYSSDNCDKHYHCTGWRIDDLWPWIYAKIMNKRNKKKYKDYPGFLMMDFV